VKIVNLTPEYEKLWDDYVYNYKDGTIFHTIIFRDIMHSVYGGKLLYLLAIDDNSKIRGILPAFIKRSLIFGKRVISTYGFFYSGPLCDNKEIYISMIEYLRDTAKRTNIKFIEIKMVSGPENKKIDNLDLVKINNYCNSLIFFTDKSPENNYQERLRRKIFSLMDNSRVKEFQFSKLKTITELKEFYTLILKFNKEKHKTISQPYILFENIYKQLILKNFTNIYIIRDKKKMIAGLLVLKFKDRVISMWDGYDKKYSYISPLKLLHHISIEDSFKEGYKIYDLGISHLSEKGLLFYKSRWGAKHFNFPFYYALIDKNAKIPDYNNIYPKIQKLVKYVPTGILKVFTPYFHRLLQ